MPSNSCSIFTPEEYLTFNIDTFWHDNVVWWWWWRAVLSLGNIFRAGRFKLDVWIVIWRNPKRQEIRPVRSLAAGKLVGWFPCRRFERRFDVWANRLETADVAVFFLPHFVLTKLQTETEINKWIKGKGGKGNGKGRKRKLAWHVHLLATLNQKSTRLDAGQVLDDVHQIIKVLLSTDRCPPPPQGGGGGGRGGEKRNQMNRESSMMGYWETELVPMDGCRGQRRPSPLIPVQLPVGLAAFSYQASLVLMDISRPRTRWKWHFFFFWIGPTSRGKWPNWMFPFLFAHFLVLIFLTLFLSFHSIFDNESPIMTKNKQTNK